MFVRYISFSSLLMFWMRVQFYVGCSVFEMDKSNLCVSVPVLDEDCGAFVRIIYDDGIIDDKLIQGLSLYVRLSLGFHGICNVMSTSSLMSSTKFIISMSVCDGMFCEALLFSCCESFVAQVDYCVCDVRLSSLVSGFLAGSRRGKFLTN